MVTFFTERDMIDFAAFANSLTRKEMLKQSSEDFQNDEEKLNERFALLTFEDLNAFISYRSEQMYLAQQNQQQENSKNESEQTA
jgi:hypothetical protein